MKRFIIVILVIMLFILVGCSLYIPINPEVQEEGSLKVHFINVGQADSILIHTGSAAMLIDGGNNGDASDVVNYIKEQGISKLDYVVGTHPHEDHIGGLDKVVNKLDIGNVIMPKVSSNTKTFESLLKAIKKKGLKVIAAKAGLKFELDSNTKCEILSPYSEKYESLNDYSAVVKLTYGNKSFLFAGDAQTTAENEMLKNGFDLKADVLKVGHHGSSSSTSNEFLKSVDPKYAVITVGKDNDYNHPHQETLKKLRNIETYRTDQNGTIIMTTDGEKISLVKEK